VKIFVLDRSLRLPAPRPAVFAFFSGVANLRRLTPPELEVRFAGPPPREITAGARFAFRLTMYGGVVSLTWSSEITRFEPPRLFVDRMRRGPYRLWLHQHVFEEVDGGTRVRDYVRWAVPLPWLLASKVARDLERIFDYRARVLDEVSGRPVDS
jgi:ligand-binding SRPBCC domain-containing protein